VCPVVDRGSSLTAPGMGAGAADERENMAYE
jgi:hypothetical protein